LKLIIQIPCLNEAATLAIALKELPRSIPGIDSIEWLVIDDGSTDQTAQIARECGVDHIVQHQVNKGLAAAFMTGITTALVHGADIIVNTDADNQYHSGDIPKLIEPIINRKAEIVIGARPITSISHFSPIKKALQLLGSYVVRLLSGTTIPDAPSGFRAISRKAALQLIVHSRYTYTIDTIIQAGGKGISMMSVPVRVNGDLRPSRLVKSVASYVRKSIATMLHIFLIYYPMRFFAGLSILFLVPGTLIGLRFLYYFIYDGGQGKIQSLILSSLLIMIGVITICIGIIAELISVNRRLIEDVRSRILELETRKVAGEVKQDIPNSAG
jgi:glycosyltransferase involved in cell wall biosynthesis